MTPEQQLADALAYEPPLKYETFFERAMEIERIKAAMHAASLRAPAYACVNNGWMARITG